MPWRYLAGGRRPHLRGDSVEASRRHQAIRPVRHTRATVLAGTDGNTRDDARNRNPEQHGKTRTLPEARLSHVCQSEIGRPQLAAWLQQLREEKPVVLALPRGGVPVGFEIAEGLDAPLDIVLVRKIGVPSRRSSSLLTPRWR